MHVFFTFVITNLKQHLLYFKIICKLLCNKYLQVPTEGKPMSNQKASGRCWIFACLNAMRCSVMPSLQCDELEFSQNYLFFWDKVGAYLHYTVCPKIFILHIFINYLLFVNMVSQNNVHSIVRKYPKISFLKIYQRY